MKFKKMHGLGNDFIVADFESVKNENINTLAEFLCDRRFGIGGDGLILRCDSEVADFKMRIINSDGTEPEMCGNGIRVFARYIWEAGITKSKSFTVETLAGIIVPEIIATEPFMVKVNMGKPELEHAKIPVDLCGNGESCISLEDASFDFTPVSMGNPHCVIMVDKLDDVDFYKYGPLIEKHEYFPKKVNVEFVELLDEGHVKLKVWERGCGETLACGTGACSVAVAASLQGISGDRTVVSLPGGDLVIEWVQGGSVFMTGPAEMVFNGEFDLNLVGQQIENWNKTKIS